MCACIWSMIDFTEAGKGERMCVYLRPSEIKNTFSFRDESRQVAFLFFSIEKLVHS